MANISVDVLPMENRVALGGTAIFECSVFGNVGVQQYDWDGPEKIVRDGRFSYGETMRTLYIYNVKEYDNQTSVKCTATAVDGRIGMDRGIIFALPGVTGTMGKNGTMDGGEIPPLTVGGGVVIAIGFILVIIAMFGALKWLKGEEIQKQKDMETARDRYSKIEIGPTASSRAQYNRDQGNVRLGSGNVRLGSYKDEQDIYDDSYEDMIPAVPKRNARGGSPIHSSSGASRGGLNSGHGRYGPPSKR